MTEDRDLEIGTKDKPKRDPSPLDSKREKEEAKLQLEKQANERDERLRRNMLRITISSLWFVSVIFAFAIFVFAWHKLTPLKWSFLDETQISTIQTFLLSSALTAFLSSVGRRMVGLYQGDGGNK